MDNGIDFLFVGGVEFIPGNVFEYWRYNSAPKGLHPTGDFEPPTEPGQHQINGVEMLLKGLWKDWYPQTRRRR